MTNPKTIDLDTLPEHLVEAIAEITDASYDLIQVTKWNNSPVFLIEVGDRTGGLDYSFLIDMNGETSDVED